MSQDEFLNLDPQKLRTVLLQLKKNLITNEEMYSKLGIDIKQAYEALKGRKGKGGFNPDLWTESNPTCGYCHRMTAVALQRFNGNNNLVPLQVSNRREKINHFFLVLNEGEQSNIIDLTRDQFREHGTVSDGSFIQNFPYEEGKILQGDNKKLHDLVNENAPATNFVRQFMKIYEHD